jgi:hypothetical protein
MAKSEVMSFDSLLDSNQRIYVKNNSIKAGIMVVLEVKDKNGRGRPLKIPPTSVPVCLTDLFSRDVLRESQDIRVAINKGNLMLVPQDQAIAELAKDSTKEELKALNLSVYADSASNATSDAVAKLAKKNKKVMDKTDVLQKSNQDDGINIRVKTTIGSYKAKEKNAKETMAQFLRLKSVLSKQDLHYIMQECADDVNIRKFAETALAELQAAGPEQPFEE